MHTPLRPDRMRSLLLAICIAAAASGGCVQRTESPRRSLRVHAVGPDDRPAGKFVFVRLTRSESMHSVRDPHDHWNEPQITHLQLSNAGSCSMIEPATPQVESFMLASSVGYKRQTEIAYRIFARGFEVWRQASDATPVRQLGSENPATLTFVLQPTGGRPAPRRTSPAAPDAGAAYLLPPPGSAAPAGDDEIILEDLRDANFWKQVETLWEISANRPAIRFVCDYYLDRLREFAQNNPRSAVPTELQGRVAWMRSAVGAPP
jgi:hypothetical protein